MSYRQIRNACAEVGLDIFASLHPATPNGFSTLLLLGPAEPGFWARITESPEFSEPDPVDRWSQRVIGKLASEFGATALFPFGGPPYQPFISWALESGHVWQSPVSLMIHPSAGLFVSFRGALAFEERLTLPEPPPASPCESCADKPCLAACPAEALTSEGYDVPACHAWLDTNAGKSCMQAGCLVRRSCPASQTYGRLQQQSAHHMQHFHKGTP